MLKLLSSVFGMLPFSKSQKTSISIVIRKTSCKIRNGYCLPKTAILTNERNANGHNMIRWDDEEILLLRNQFYQNHIRRSVLHIVPILFQNSIQLKMERVSPRENQGLFSTVIN